jgi:Na+/proline symporter
VGLLIASVLAANMAACSAFMINSGALFTRNVYQKYLLQSADDEHYLLVGRLSGVAITVLSVLYAVFLITRVLYSFLLTETLSTFVGIGLLGGTIWPRANRWGAIASLVTSVSVNFTWYFIRGQRLDQWEPTVFVAALIAGVMALILVSMLTKPEPEHALRSFFRKLQTSSDEDFTEVLTEACLPVNAPREDTAASGKQSLVVNLLNPRRGAAGVSFLRAYSNDLVGLAAGFGLALGLVLFVWFLFNK